MIAVLFSTGCRLAIQAVERALSSPSANHLKNGAFDLSSVWVKGLCQLRVLAPRLGPEAFEVLLGLGAQGAW